MTPKRVTCRSANVIYCIECDSCGLQYVGQTKNQLRKHMNNYFSTIRNSYDTLVAHHLNKKHNLYIPKITVTILQLIRSSDNKDNDMRNIWENIWIGRLNTIAPKGLNIQD